MGIVCPDLTLILLAFYAILPAKYSAFYMMGTNRYISQLIILEHGISMELRFANGHVWCHNCEVTNFSMGQTEIRKHDKGPSPHHAA